MKKLWILILLLIIGAGGFVYFSPMFEKNPPKITIKTDGYTNLKNPIEVDLKDDSGIKSYTVVLMNGNNTEVIASADNPNMGKNVTLKIKLPKNIKANEIRLVVTAVDTSKWHFFAGNEAQKSVTLEVDKVAPDAQVVNNSYAIGRGGSAAAVVQVNDKNLKDAYILVDGKYKFKLTPFYKKGYYVALIAWPIWENNFDATLVAEDYAGNIVREHIPYYWRTRGIYNPKDVKIRINDKFINQVAKRLLERIGMSIPNDPVEIFKKVNETVRKINEAKISQITSPVYEEKINSFYIRRFNPLPGSAKRADFGEKRHYYFKGEQISFAIHKGVDLAKIKRAKIYANNNGRVVANEYIGIYGNALIIYHGLGLYTLYGHTSEFKVKKGDSVHNGMVIARTGATGAVFGDHLHFGVYVQGIPVQPLEWMDSHWIKTNILNVINGAKRMIK
ncbi:M23 family metallopeptidase [Caminibacter pacificus]